MLQYSSSVIPYVSQILTAQVAVERTRRLALWWVAQRGPGCGALRLVVIPSSVQSMHGLRRACTLFGGNRLLRFATTSGCGRRSRRSGR